jgi:putative two-component system response regulator
MKLKMIKKPVVLVVDDIPSNIDILLETLGGEYEIMVALDGETALEHVRRNMPDIILLDIMMPVMDGYEVCRRLKSDPSTAEIPVIFVTAMNESVNEEKGLELGAIDYIIKPFSPAIVKARVKNHIMFQLAKEAVERQNDILEEMVEERTKELNITQNVTIQCMASLAETRDVDTGEHIRRTQFYVRILAEKLKNSSRFSGVLTKENIDLIFRSAPLHDIGKVGVPDNILLKRGPLSPEEFEKMKQHTVYGRNALLDAERMLGTNSFLRFAREIAYTHHERWDGTGYPEGLKGENIPVSGRLMAIADIYDALISPRVYKPAFSHEEAVRIITVGDGRVMPGYFDPEVLEAFMSSLEDFRLITSKYPSSEGRK